MRPVLRRFRRFTLCTLATLASFLFSSSPPALAQKPAQLSVQQPKLSGNWIGSFDVVSADGSVDPGSLYLILVQDGAHLTGSAGQSATKQSPISKATLAGNTVTLTVDVSAGTAVTLQLALENGRLRGNATGLPAEAGSSIIVNAVRADASWHASAEIPHVRDRLFDTVAGLDTKLFHAYNTCDLNTLAAIVTSDLEFYHDKTGLAVGRQPFVDSIRNNICDKVERTLVPGSLEVYRLHHYGAVEIGSHRFRQPHHPEDGEGEAKFFMLWQFRNGDWKLSRVISYDHGAMQK